MKLPLDADYILLIPENHHLAKQDGQTITVNIVIEKFAKEPFLFKTDDLLNCKDIQQRPREQMPLNFNLGV